MDFPIPATLTPMENIVVFDPEAKIVVNTGSYSMANYETMTAEVLSNKLKTLTNLSQRVTNYETCDENARQYLIENYDEIGSEHADEIARLLCIDLTESIEIELDVKITATVLVPAGKKFDDLSEYDFDITFETNEHDYEVEEFDAGIYRMRQA